MDYKEKYEAALAKAERIYESATMLGDITGYDLAEIFPELAESEDERIRRILVESFEKANCSKVDELVDCRLTKGKILAWLEKHKERGPLTKEEEYTLNRIIEYLEDEDCPSEWRNLLLDIHNLPYEKQKEQKPAEWESEYAEEDLQTRFAFYTYKDEPKMLYLSNLFVEESSRNHGYGTRILEATEEVADVFGANFIRLKVKKDSPVNEWYRKHGYELNCTEDDYDWLEKDLTKEPIEEFIPVEKTLEYKVGFNDGVKSIKSAEWSEEDEKLLDSWLDVIDRNDWRMDENFCKASREFINKLKSLRPQPHWKPSEEQMEALRHAVALAAGNKVLAGLYEQLKKL